MDNMKTSIEKIRQNKIDELTTMAWNYAHATLWKGYPFSEQEVKDAKKQIRKYFEAIPFETFFIEAPDKLMELTIRVLITVDYIQRKPGRYVNHPAAWFNPNNKFGFAGTKRWYDNLEKEVAYESMRFYYENGKLKSNAA